jgi:hypothetical protein
VIVNTPEKLAQYWNDYRIEISEVDQLSDTSIMITYKEKEEQIMEHPSSNILLSLWTTSAARLVLFTHMKKVAEMEGAEIIYYDTGN